MNTRKAKASRPVDRLVHRRVYQGWIDPDPTSQELPKQVEKLTRIVFGNTKWNKQNVRCRITVEWAEVVVKRRK